MFEGLPHVPAKIRQFLVDSLKRHFVRLCVFWRGCSERGLSVDRALVSSVVVVGWRVRVCVVCGG